MAIDKELLEILVCPSCRGEVVYQADPELIICTKCGLQYPVRDDIPVMLIEEATKPGAS
jgi:uncharacterized protein YbaR (Trm112 family)